MSTVLICLSEVDSKDIDLFNINSPTIKTQLKMGVNEFTCVFRQIVVFLTICLSLSSGSAHQRTQNRQIKRLANAQEHVKTVNWIAT